MQPMGYGAPLYPAQPEQGSGMAIAGLILGILSVPFALFAACGFVFGILGLTFSILGRKSISRHTVATVGIVFSCIGLALAVVSAVIGAISSVNGLVH
jgi:hypothetical protein